MNNPSLSTNFYFPEPFSPSLKNHDDLHNFSLNPTKPDSLIFQNMKEKLKSNALFSYLSEKYINQLAEEFQYCRECENQTLFKHSDKIACVFILVKGCLEIINHQNSHSYMLFSGGTFGESSIFMNDYLTNYTIKALDDSLFFIISKASLLNFFKKIIYTEYDINSQAINEIILFRNFSPEIKEKMAINSMKHKIFGDIGKIEDENNNCILKQREKYIFLNLFNRNIFEIHITKLLKKIIRLHENFSDFNKIDLVEIMTKMIIKNYQNQQKICPIENEQNDRKMFIILKGFVAEKNGEIFNIKFKEGEIFYNLDQKNYFSFENSIISELDMSIFEQFKAKTTERTEEPKELSKKNNHANSNPKEKILTEDFFKNLLFVKKLGEGQFGKVVLVKESVSQEYYALKCISKKQTYYEHIKQSIKEEKIALEYLDNPMLVQYKGYYEDDSYHYFLMEYIKGIELFELMKDINYLTVNQCKFYAASLILILEYLHSNHVIYRDLKPENIMVDQKGYLKLIDMGSCKIVGEKDHINEFCGTVHYMAPEIIRRKEYSYSVDLWSLGIIIFELVCGFLPFGENCEEQCHIHAEILNNDLDIPTFVDPLLTDLIEKLLLKDPVERTKQTFQTLKNLPFFNNFDWDALKSKKLNAPYIPPNVLKNNQSADNVTHYNLPMYELVKEEKNRIKETRSKENFADF